MGGRDADDGDDAAEGDDASDERHLFGDERPTEVGLIASEMGVLRVELAPDRIGGFGLVERCTARDVETDGETVVVGTDEDVFVYTENAGEFTAFGFGPVVAVGIDGGSIFAAGADGQVGKASVEQATGAETNWERIGEVSGPRQFDGDFLATDTGVVQVGERLDVLGLSDVSDVARANSSDEPVLFAGTADGLYRRADSEWVQAHDIPVQRVSFDGSEGFVVTADGRLLRGDGESWEDVSLPEGKAAFDVVNGESLFVVTRDGEIMIAAEETAASDGFEGWRTQPLGVRGVVGFVLLD